MEREMMIDAESAHTASCLEYERCTAALDAADGQPEYDAALLAWEVGAPDSSWCTCTHLMHPMRQAAVDEMNSAFRTYDNAYRLWAIS